MNDLFGKALLDYQNGTYSEDIRTTSSLDEDDVLPLPYLFRGFGDMPLLERKALSLCRGRTLDIGCGAGGHSLYLQEMGFEVTGLDSSKGAITTCRLRGIENLVESDILDFGGTVNGTSRRYDTLLMLMNGIGIVGRLERLDDYLAHLKSLLRPNGQILLDSSDIIYMYEDFETDEAGSFTDGAPRENLPFSAQGVSRKDLPYYGEVEFTMYYKGQKSDPFHWLYVDYSTLQSAAVRSGFRCECLAKGPHYDYLARLW